MGKARDYIPALKFGHKIYPEDLAIGNPWSNYFYVDGDNGSDTANTGKSIDKAKVTIQAAVTAAVEGDVIIVRPKTPGIWDPVGYEETVIIPYATPNLTIAGISTNNTYGAMPHMAIGAGSTAMITVRAPGCRITGLSFAGTSSTGGGILFDDDSSTKSAYGTTIDNCYFYECLGSAAAATGGAIMWSAEGGAWQTRILNNYFMSCRGGIILKGTSSSRPTDVFIQGNTFSSWVNTEVDIDIDLGNGSGAQGVIIDNNYFGTVDVPGYAGAGATARYLDLTGCEGILSNNQFACKTGTDDTPVTFGASTHTAGIVPATIRMARNYGESAVGSDDKAKGEIVRTD